MSDATIDNLWDLWRAAARRSAIDQAIRDLYGRLDAAVQQRGPTCWLSGKCCNFDAYGHRLYVTGLEIAWVLVRLRAEMPGAWSEKGKANAFATTGPCAFQVNKLCSVHAIRPLGCRVFFCQQGTQQWQQELYEQFLDELRHLHDTHNLPYRYMEWRSGLRDAVG